MSARRRKGIGIAVVTLKATTADGQEVVLVSWRGRLGSGSLARRVGRVLAASEAEPRFKVKPSARRNQ